MKAKVKLSAIVDGMEMQSNELHQYLHLATGNIYPISDEDFNYANDDSLRDDIPAWQIESVEIAKKVKSTEEYIQLPDQFEIHEYSMMERFCLSLNNGVQREKMSHAIKGSGAFRRFKENLYHFDIQDNWYRFKKATLFEHASAWCKQNEIPFIDDSGETE